MKDEDVVPQIKLSVFHFPFFVVDSFWVFSYAYGGLHRWSSRGKKAAKVVFDSKKKYTHTHKKKNVTKKGKKE